jgi:hypothetical protein
MQGQPNRAQRDRVKLLLNNGAVESSLQQAAFGDILRNSLMQSQMYSSRREFPNVSSATDALTRLIDLPQVTGTGS